MRVFTSLLALVALAFGNQAMAAEKPAFDARLSGYDYPYPVHTLKLDSQRQTLEMAYMDVRPDQPNGDTVLLLHGKNFSGAYWQTTIERLTEEGYRVVVPDQIGFGKSSKPEYFQYAFQTLADHTRTLLDELNVDDVTVMGHSMGGMLATRFVLMFPERSDRLVLVNPIGLEDWRKHVPWQSVDAWYQGELKKKARRHQGLHDQGVLRRPVERPLSAAADSSAGLAARPRLQAHCVELGTALRHDLQPAGGLRIPRH